jgi:uncharacterized protein
MYADKFHTKTAPPKLMTTTTYAAHTVKFGPQKLERFKQLVAEFGEPDLQALSRKYGLEII